MEKVMLKSIKSDVRGYIEKNLVKFDEVDFSDNDNIFAKGFVNSLFAMKLLSFIENRYLIEIDDDDIEISNFSSVNNIAQLVSKKKDAVDE